MKRLLLFLLAVASTAIPLAPRATDVYAFSVGPDFDLVEDSDLIVGGRFTGWELDSDSGGAAQVYDPKQSGGLVLAYAGIRAKMAVDSVFKGTASSEITVASSNTLNVYDHEPKYVWIGPAGACGAFGSDPTDVYAIMGLSAKDDGTYGAAIFTWFYSGDNPPSDFENRSLSRLKPLLPGYPPSSSPEHPDDSLDPPAPPDSAEFPVLPSVALAVIGPLAFLAGAAFVWRRG